MAQLSLSNNEKWLRQMATSEEEGWVGAGYLVERSDEQVPIVQQSSSPSQSVPSRLVFSRLISLRRRHFGLSMEEVATRTGADLEEIFRVEHDEGFSLEPRLVFTLAHTLSLPEATLMQLAGLAVAKNPLLSRAAVRFAAKSEPVDKLSRAEHEALEEFVKLLADQ